VPVSLTDAGSSAVPLGTGPRGRAAAASRQGEPHGADGGRGSDGAGRV